MSELGQCCVDVREPGRWPRYHQCRRAATVTRDGKSYCTAHDPERIQEREKAKRVALEAGRDALARKHAVALRGRYLRKKG